MIVRLATIEDARDIAARLRAADLDEVMKDYNTNVEGTICYGVAASDEVLVYEIEGLVICIGGVLRDQDGGGVVWQLGSPEIESHAKQYIRETRKIMRRWMKQYTLLHNLVGARNEVSLRYLKHLGYTIEPTVTLLGERQVPFRYFWIRGDANVQS